MCTSSLKEIPKPKWTEVIAHAGAAVFFVLVTAWLTWPLFGRMGTGLRASPDPLLNIWALGWNFHILSGDPASLFDANIFFPRGDTLAYSEHLFGIALLSWPVYLVSDNLVWAYNFAMALSFVLSGLGMYLLTRELTGSWWAGLFAGIVYAAAPYRFLHLFHIQLLSSQWFPFVFWFLYRFLRDGRPRQLFGVIVTALLQILCCNYYAVYLVVALALFVGATAVAGRRLVTVKKAVALAVGLATVALTALPFFLPYERNRVEQGFYRRYEDVVQFSATPLDYLRPSSFNKVFYVDYLPQQLRSEKALFPGLAAILLGGLGLFVGKRTNHEEGFSEGRRLMWLTFGGLVAVSLVLSLGPQIRIGDETYFLPYRFLYRYVPGFGLMRVPARFAVVVLLGLAVLSGLGLSWLLGKAGRRKHWVGAAAAGLLLFEYQSSSLAHILPPAPSIPPVYQWLASQPEDFGVLELPIHEDITKEAIRMYYSTAHWKRLANGFSGWWPNDYWVLVGRMRTFPTAGILRFLERDVPARFILIHYDQYPPGRREKLQRDMYRYRMRMPARAQFGQDVVYELLPEAQTESSKTGKTSHR